jgi:hypothetical protein
MQWELDPLGDFGTAYVTLAVPGETSGRTTGTNLAVFVEDQIKPTSGLQITAGLRVDREEILAQGLEPFDPQAEFERFLEISQTNPGIAMALAFTRYPDVPGFRQTLADMLGVPLSQIILSDTLASSVDWQQTRRSVDVALTNTNVSPRFSLAWDPWKDGKTKIAFSAGRYYDKLFLGIPLLELEPPSTTLTIDARRVQDDYLAFGLNQSFNPTISVQTVDRGLDTPYNDEYMLSFERAIFNETTIKATYIRREFRDQLQDIDINHVPGDRGTCEFADDPGEPQVVASPGSGQTVEDENTGEEYIDTDPGTGDGRIDDCTGAVIRFDLFSAPVVVPDGLADLYVLNPGWGEILLVGNFNETDYESYVVELVRRLYRGWQMNASYTWSEAVGNAEDFDQVLGNERNLVEDEQGYLSYDQRHVVRLHFTTVAAHGFRLGAFLRWESGLPWSVLVSRDTLFATPPEFGLAGGREADFRLRYPTRQRNDRRNESFWTLDLRVARELRIAKRVDTQITAEVFNVLDDQSLRVDDLTNGNLAGERRFGRRFQVGLRFGF